MTQNTRQGEIYLIRALKSIGDTKKRPAVVSINTRNLQHCSVCPIYQWLNWRWNQPHLSSGCRRWARSRLTLGQYETWVTGLDQPEPLQRIQRGIGSDRTVLSKSTVSYSQVARPDAVTRPVLKERSGLVIDIDSNTQYRYCKQIAVKPSAGSVFQSLQRIDHWRILTLRGDRPW